MSSLLHCGDNNAFRSAAKLRVEPQLYRVGFIQYSLGPQSPVSIGACQRRWHVHEEYSSAPPTVQLVRRAASRSTTLSPLKTKYVVISAYTLSHCQFLAVRHIYGAHGTLTVFEAWRAVGIEQAMGWCAQNQA